MRLLASTGVSQLRDLDEVADIYDSFKDPRTRAAIAHVVRAVVDWRGQIVTMADRAYLTEAMPMCVVWGADDIVIPVTHASNASALAPTARIEVLPNAGHFRTRTTPSASPRSCATSSARPSRATTTGSAGASCSTRELGGAHPGAGRARHRSPRCTPYDAQRA